MSYFSGYMKDKIEYNDESDTLGHYNQDVLDLILRCMGNLSLLHIYNMQLKVGDGPLKNYFDFFNKLKEYFSLDRNIVEFGFGDFPIMSFLIDLEQQKLGSGKITAYDKLYTGETYERRIAPLGNIHFVDEFIEEDTDLGDCDLIFGVYPCCPGSFKLIDKANSLDIDFFLVLCDCPPFYKNHDYFFEYAQKSLPEGSELLVDKKSCFGTPIIIKRKIENHK